jgi:hypothetical protein
VRPSVGSSRRTAVNASFGVLPLNARLPLSISKSTTPSENRSMGVGPEPPRLLLRSARRRGAPRAEAGSSAPGGNEERAVVDAAARGEVLEQAGRFSTSLHYCLSKTTVEDTGLPSASVPLAVCVIVLPSAEMTV